MLPQHSAKAQRSSSMMSPSKNVLRCQSLADKKLGLSSLHEDTPKMGFVSTILDNGEEPCANQKLPLALITKEMLHQPMIKFFEIPSKDAMT